MIDRITIAVDSMESMVQFYSAVLGVEFTEGTMFKRVLYRGAFGNIDLLLCPKDLAGVEANVNTIQLRFLVPDVQEAFTNGVKLGVVTLSEPSMVEDTMQAALRDPDGNSLELAEQA